MIDCSEFLDGYSEFRDGLLDDGSSRNFRDHLASCRSCARYDRVFSGGIDVLLRLPEVDPSADFADRLRHRLHDIDEEILRERYSSGASVGLTVAIAICIGAAAWLPAIRAERAPVLLPPAIAHAPYHPQLLPLVFHPGVPDHGEPSAPPSGHHDPRAFSPYSLLGTTASPPQIGVPVGH